MTPPYRVLAIDGGGIRGLIPALVLDRIEQRVGRPIAECFDLIAGTSTGGILAVGLSCAGDDRPRWSAADLVALYETEGPRIFDRSLVKTLTSVFGIEDEKYSRENLEEPLDRYLGAARLRDALTELLVPAYETERRFPYFFRRTAARADPAHDFAVSDVASAHAAWVSVMTATSTVQTTTASCQFPIASPYPCSRDLRHL